MIFFFQLFFDYRKLMFFKGNFVLEKRDIFWIILIFLAMVILKLFVIGLNFFNFFLQFVHLLFKVKRCLSLYLRRTWFDNSLLNFFELIDLMINLFLSFVGFNFDGLKKMFNLTNKAIDLFLFFNFVLNHNFFKALIKIQENEIVSGLV